MNNNIETQIISEMVELRNRRVNSSQSYIESIFVDRIDTFGIQTVDRIGELSRDKLWQLIWLYLKQGHDIKGMNEKDFDIILNPMHFINSKILNKDKETLTQNIMKACMNSSEIPFNGVIE